MTQIFCNPKKKYLEMLTVNFTIWYTQKVNSNKVILPSSQPYKFEKASFCLYPPPPSPSHVEADFWLPPA